MSDFIRYGNHTQETEQARKEGLRLLRIEERAVLIEQRKRTRQRFGFSHYNVYRGKRLRKSE